MTMSATFYEGARMRVVSENSEKDIERHRLENEITYSMQELAANLMRITRGAGKPYDVGKRAAKLVRLMVEYHENAGHCPSSDFLMKTPSFLWTRPHRVPGYRDGGGQGADNRRSLTSVRIEAH